LTHIRIEQAQVQSGINMRWIDLKGLQELLFCQFIGNAHLIGNGQPKVVISTVGIDIQGLLKGTDRFFCLVQLTVGHAQVEKDTVFLKSEGNGLLVVRYLLHMVARLPVAISKVVQGKRIRRFFLQEALMKRNSSLVILPLHGIVGCFVTGPRFLKNSPLFQGTLRTARS